MCPDLGRFFIYPPMTRYQKTKKAQQALSDRICDWARLGYSRTQIASELDIAVETLEDWETQHVILAEALIKAETLARSWWETLGQKLARDGGGQASTYGFIMKNRFGDFYRDQTERRLTVAPGLESDTLSRAINALDPQTCDAIRKLLER